MVTTTQAPSQQFVQVAGGKVRVLHGGRGDAIVVIHHDIGTHGWLPLYEQLAQSHTVYVPDLPGYGESERPEWARFVRDEAILMNLLLDTMGLGTITLVGLGYGGWIAAEMATMHQERISSMVLVGAMGLQPQEGQGEIVDQFIYSHLDYLRMFFADPAAYDRHFGDAPDEVLAALDLNREMTTRIGWKPYMFSQQLGPLLRSVRVRTLIAWGSEDRVVPRNCADRYLEALPDARLELVDGAGHAVDMEDPDALAKLINGHIAT